MHRLESFLWCVWNTAAKLSCGTFFRPWPAASTPITARSPPTIAGPPSPIVISPQNVFDVPELLAAILEVVPPLELFNIQLINRQFHGSITSSRTLQDLQLNAVLKPLRAPPLNPNRAGDISFARLFNTLFSPLSERLRLRHLVIEPFKFEMLANGGGKQANGDKQVPELHFSLDFRISRETRHVEFPLVLRAPGGTGGPHQSPYDDSEEKCWDAVPELKNNQTIGYYGQCKVHSLDQSWSCMSMTKDREPFDIIVWVFGENGDFYKHFVRFGPGIKIMRDLFDLLTDLLGRSIERHENEAQLATLHGRC